MVQLFSRVCGLLLFVLAAGCGQKPAQSPVPVRGVLKLDGNPVSGAVVTFQPEDPSSKAAFGTVAPDGTFRLTTDSPGDGAVPGKYKVIIQPPVEGGATPFDDPTKPAARPKSSGLKVPEKYTRLDLTPLTQDVPSAGPVVFELNSK